MGLSASFAGPSSRSALAGRTRKSVSEARSMRLGHGFSVTKRTVESLTIWTSFTGFQYAALWLLLARVWGDSIGAFPDSRLKDSPWWRRTPWRDVHCQPRS